MPSDREGSAPIVLVPGFWLGAWAWDEVADLLRGEGFEVTAVTLLGLNSVDEDRSAITFADHVDAICQTVAAQGRPVVLAVHSASGSPGYEVTDRMPDSIAAMVYVDSAPATGPLDPGFADDELAMPTLDDLAAEENVDGLSDDHLSRFRDRAVPQPGASLREGPTLRHDTRLEVPSTVICTGFSSDQVKAAVDEGYPWLGGLTELRNVTYLDLPTSHWPMWSRPHDLAAIIADVARSATAT